MVRDMFYTLPGETSSMQKRKQSFANSLRSGTVIVLLSAKSKMCAVLLCTLGMQGQFCVVLCVQMSRNSF